MLNSIEFEVVSNTIIVHDTKPILPLRQTGCNLSENKHVRLLLSILSLFLTQQAISRYDGN